MDVLLDRRQRANSLGVREGHGSGGGGGGGGGKDGGGGGGGGGGGTNVGGGDIGSVEAGPEGSNIRWDDAKVHHEFEEALERIKAAPVLMFPFPHVHIEPLFSAEFYEGLMRELPPKDVYQRAAYVQATAMNFIAKI